MYFIVFFVLSFLTQARAKGRLVDTLVAKLFAQMVWPFQHLDSGETLVGTTLAMTQTDKSLRVLYNNEWVGLHPVTPRRMLRYMEPHVCFIPHSLLPPLRSTSLCKQVSILGSIPIMIDAWAQPYTKVVCNANLPWISEKTIATAAGLALELPVRDVRHEAWEWMANLGTPAALVSAASIASYFETRDSMTPNEDDPACIALFKSMVQCLLLTAFCCEISTVFITTFTGTMLLGSADKAGNTIINTFARSATGMLVRELEFEYLAARVGFLQGIMNWLLAMATQVLIPERKVALSGQNTSHARPVFAGSVDRMLALASANMIVTIVMLMLAFYNKHLNFYSNYGHMVCRLAELTFKRFFLSWPPRVMPFLALVPGMFSVSYLTMALWKVLTPTGELLNKTVSARYESFKSETKPHRSRLLKVLRRVGKLPKPRR